MKYSSSVIEQALFLSGCGVSVARICELLAVSDTTFYNWKTKFSGLNAAGIELQCQLEKELKALSRQVEQLALDKSVLQSVIEANMDASVKRKQLDPLLKRQPITEQRALKLLSLI